MHVILLCDHISCFFVALISPKVLEISQYNKYGVFRYFRQFKEKLEGERGTRMQVLRSDQGGKYLSQEFKDYCMEHGIERELTQVKMPQ